MTGPDVRRAGSRPRLDESGEAVVAVVAERLRVIMSSCPRCRERDRVEAARAVAGDRVRERIEALPPRRRAVFDLVVSGRTNVDVARALFVSETTVRSMVRALLREFEVDSRIDLTVLAVRAGLSPGSVADG